MSSTVIQKIKPKVGQKLFVVRSGRMTTRTAQYEEVVKVGSKYFWMIDGSRWENKLHIDGMSSQNYNFPVRAYLSEQDYQDEKECVSWQGVMRKAFSVTGGGQYSLEQYRKVGEILGIDVQKTTTKE